MSRSLCFALECWCVARRSLAESPNLFFRLGHRFGILREESVGVMSEYMMSREFGIEGICRIYSFR